MSAQGQCDPINNFETNTDRGRRQASKRGAAAGRYDRRTHNTRLPPDGTARAPSSRNTDTVVAAVQDPWGNGQERLLATVNRRVDLLELERSHDRISESAYRTGRLIQAIFERLGKLSGSNWCGTSRVDPMLAQELNIIRSLDSAEKIHRLVNRISDRVGMIDTRLLKRLLGDRLSFTEAAGLQGKGGERGATYIAGRFRDALEDLAEAWVGKGKALPMPDDKHLDAAGAVPARQIASMKAGVTAARVKAEAVATAKGGKC